MAWLGAAVSVAIILMKVVPSVPGSFTRAEWIAFVAWSARRGLLAAPPAADKPRERLLDELVLRQRAEYLDRLRSPPSSARR